MLSDMLSFTSLLRRAGMTVSTSELLDFVEAVKLTGVSREDLLTAMEATLTKQENHGSILRRLFDLFWDRTGGAPANEKMSAVFPKPAPKMERAQFHNKLDELKNYIRKEKMRLAEVKSGAAMSMGVSGRNTSGSGKNRPPENLISPEKLASAILEGNEDKMRRLARNALDGISVDAGDERELLRQIRILTGWAEGEDPPGKISRSGTGPDRWEIMARLERFAEIATRETDRLIWSRRPERVLSRLNAEEVSFNSLDYDQSREIKRKLLRMGKNLAVRAGYRYAPSRTGKVDLRRTTALAGALGGVPAGLLFRSRRPLRPEIVILCDLSGSVANFSRFMMLLVSAMQDRFRSARSFAFVDAVEEVTSLIRGWDAEKKISEILRNTSIWRTGFSDYGEVWKQFAERYGGVVGPKTTLIILGDARNNYKPDGIDQFSKIARGAKRVIWLNPAPAEGWDSEDGIMSRYAPFCHRVFECRNIRQLEKVVRDVFN